VAAATSGGLFAVEPMEGHYTAGSSMELGAHVTGLDPRQPLSPTVANALRAALLVHKVLVLSDQPISDAQHVALASAFGPPTIGHVFLREARHQVEGYPEVFRLHRDGVSEQEAAGALANVIDASQVHNQSESGRSWWHRRWHTDVTGAINPPWLSILRAEVTSSSWSSHQWVAEHVHPSGAYPGHTHWVNLAAAYRYLPQVGPGFDEIVYCRSFFCHLDA
jgi:alpha-ketoglutarate-dependent taurine dioxygenase